MRQQHSLHVRAHKEDKGASLDDGRPLFERPFVELDVPHPRGVVPARGHHARSVRADVTVRPICADSGEAALPPVLTARDPRRMAKRSSSAARRHWTEADARSVLADWERSGDTLEAFARSRGLVPQRLWWWRKRLRELPPEAPKALTFVPATVIDPELATRVAVIRLPHGVVIELAGASPSWVAALARELSRSS